MSAVHGFGWACGMYCVFCTYCVHALCVCVFMSVVNLGIVCYVSLLSLCSVCPVRVLGVALVHCGLHRGTACGNGMVIRICVYVV